MILNQASFRDPVGRVYEQNNRVFRKVNNSHREFFNRFLSSAFFIQNRKKIVDTKFIDSIPGEKKKPTTTFWLEHEKIELITYPHEWGFETLKRVALFHLQLQKEAFAEGFVLKDASPYNVQLKDGEPIFIDLLSFEDYREGSFWYGYNQFCDNFLNPLLIRSFSGIEHNQFFRGSIDGINTKITSKLLPMRSWLSYNAVAHVHLKAWAEKKVDSTSSGLFLPPQSGVSSKNLIALWESLARFIDKLKVREKTFWGDYENNTSYSVASENVKSQLIARFISKNGLQTVVDLGCNSGRYSRISLKNGAKRVIGLDFDGVAVDKANSDNFLRKQNFIALQFDLMNPSPAIGWQNRERVTLFDRLPQVDAVICLALIHHICVAKIVPITGCVKSLFTLSDNVLVEFVPKTDPMVKGLLSRRVDVFSDYSEETFKEAVLKFGKILAMHPIEGSERKIYICQSK